MTVLKFVSNDYYLNPSRVSPDSLTVYDPVPVPVPPNSRKDTWIARRESTEPAVFVSLVVVEDSQLTSPETFKATGSDKLYDKKYLIANLFPQEIDYLTSVFGTVFDTDYLIMPIWFGRGAKKGHENLNLGFTFGTRMLPKNSESSRLHDRLDLTCPYADVPQNWGGNGRRSGNFREDTSVTPYGRIQPALWCTAAGISGSGIGL